MSHFFPYEWLRNTILGGCNGCKSGCARQLNCCVPLQHGKWKLQDWWRERDWLYNKHGESREFFFRPSSPSFPNIIDLGVRCSFSPRTVKQCEVCCCNWQKSNCEVHNNLLKAQISIWYRMSTTALGDNLVWRKKKTGHHTNITVLEIGWSFYRLGTKQRWQGALHSMHFCFILGFRKSGFHVMRNHLFLSTSNTQHLSKRAQSYCFLTFKAVIFISYDIWKCQKCQK